MGDRLVQLSSRSHHDNILGCLHQLRLVGQLVDITVQVDHQGTGELEEFQAHQVILAASSGYFKRLLLSQDPVPDKLFLSNIRTANFSKFLEFVYTGKVEVARDKIGDVREAARLLDCQDLSEVCEEAMVAGDSREPDKGACSPSSDPERAGVDGAERKRPLKRKLSLKSSKRGLNRPKMLRAIEVAKGKEVQSEEAGIRRLSIRLAGHKIPMGVLVHEWKVENEENGDQDTHLETKTQKESPEKMGEEFPATDLASDGDNDDEEGEEEDEGNIMNDDPNDPLYMSPEDDGEEGDSLRTLKKTPKAQFQCDKCLRAFHYERSYLKHISTYHGVKAEVVYRCETCQQTFANRGNLKIHEKHVHSDERLFACQICAKSFKRKKDVIRHQRQVHEGIGIRHVCPDCGKTLSSKTALLLHERTHSGLKPFQCTVCAAKFTQSSALKMHLRTHTGEKPFACDLCEARFTQKHMLCYHKRSHTGEKPFMCEACGKSFASKEYLRHHSNIHTGSRPYKCEQCGRGFAQRNSLHQHLKIHTGERPYSCKDCDKQFTQLNALQRHQRIHTGEKPYMCGLCNRTFTDKSTVRRHTMTHDTDAPWKNYLVVLDGNVEGKKPKGSGEKSDAGELQVHVGGVAADHEGAKAPTAEAMVVPEEPVSLPAGWAQHGTISLVSHGALGGITVIHTADMPPGTHLQPLVTADGTSIISLDSSISMPFSLPVSMAHPVPAVSTMSSTIPVSLTLPMISSSSTASVPTASVLEAAVSQTILAPPSEAEQEDEAHINLSEPDIHTVVISEKHCSNLKQRDDVVAPDEGRERTAEETSADKEDTSTEDAV